MSLETHLGYDSALVVDGRRLNFLEKKLSDQAMATMAIRLPSHYYIGVELGLGISRLTIEKGTPSCGSLSHSLYDGGVTVMQELELLRDTFGELGRGYVSLQFESHPIWNTLRDLPVEATIVIIDNTTVRNALTLMREGLGGKDSFNAALLPDLSLLFFALTHFEDIILLDHGLNEQETEEVAQIFGSSIRRFSWRDEIRNNESLKYDLFLKFSSIQAVFSQRTELHEEWGQAWSKLLGAKNIRPLYFSEGLLDKLIDSPEHPLSRDVEGLDQSWPHVLNPKLTEIERLPRNWWGGQLLGPSHYASALASYHTFRSLFYYCLSEYLNYPYLACGMRGVATNFLPVEFLNRSTDHLNPELRVNLMTLSMQPVYKRLPPIVELPVLRVTPTLAKVINVYRRFTVPNWNAIVHELRYESSEYRKNMSSFFEACTDEAFDYKKVVELARILGGDKVSEKGWDMLSSALKIGGSLAQSYVARNPLQTVEGLREAVRSKPWDFVIHWLQRRRLTFILHARDLAAAALSLEGECKKTWGRGFSIEERLYLERLQQVSPLYGL